MKNAAPRKPTKDDTRSTRDGAQVWIEGTLDMVVNNGIGPIKVERLARQIGVSKGGFYWFFKNSDELLLRCLEHWQENLNGAVITAAKSSSGPARKRLFDMIDLVFDSKLGRYDAAIRTWAMSDPKVHIVVTTVDRDRLDFLVGLFEEHGLDHDSAKHRAHLFYRAFVAESYLRAYPDKLRKGAYLKELLDSLLAVQPAKANSATYRIK